MCCETPSSRLTTVSILVATSAYPASGEIGRLDLVARPGEYGSIKGWQPR